MAEQQPAKQSEVEITLLDKTPDNPPHKMATSAHQVLIWTAVGSIVASALLIGIAVSRRRS